MNKVNIFPDNTHIGYCRYAILCVLTVICKSYAIFISAFRTPKSPKFTFNGLKRRILGIVSRYLIKVWPECALQCISYTSGIAEIKAFCLLVDGRKVILILKCPSVSYFLYHFHGGAHLFLIVQSKSSIDINWPSRSIRFLYFGSHIKGKRFQLSLFSL